MSNNVELTLRRNVCNENFTLGELLIGNDRLGYTCEDTDRRLERDPTAKIHGVTAIPRGRYRLTASLSNRFKRVMPEIKDVPLFSGVRIHAGNTAANSEGCPLLGAVLTANGVRDCAKVNNELLDLILATEKVGGQCWITVK